MTTSNAATLTEPPRVNAKVIADFYSVAVPTIYKWAKEGKIPSVKFEDTVRFDMAAVRAVIEGKRA